MATETVKNEVEDDLAAMEARDTARKLPTGWLVLFWGLVVWGLYYLWAYSPWTTGWVQTRDLDQPAAAAGSPGVNVFATILFTAIPTAFAVGIMWARSRASRKR